jgi:hypothetical protein
MGNGVAPKHLILCFALVEPLNRSAFVRLLPDYGATGETLHRYIRKTLNSGERNTAKSKPLEFARLRDFDAENLVLARRVRT